MSLYALTLGAVDLLLGLIFLATMITGMVLAGRSPRVPLRRVSAAIRFYTAAFLTAAANVIVNVLDIPHDGFLQPLMWGGSLALTGLIIKYALRRRAAIGEIVMYDAERTVREFARGDGELR